MYSGGPVTQVFSQRASDELDWSYDKNGGQFELFSDDEESEWLENIDPSLLDKSNEEKQLDDSEICHHLLKKIETAAQQRRRKLTLMFGLAGATPKM